jgi:predicted SnoaL-like aldol condensation-catalyzing enzyme
VSTEQNKALVNRFIDEVLNKKNLAVTDEIAVEDFVELDPLPGQGPGREGLKQILSVLFSAFPDQQWTVEEQAAEGERSGVGSPGGAPTRGSSWASLLPAER